MAAQRQAFRLVYDRGALKHLERIDRKLYALIRDTIQEQLSFEPLRKTKNRKPLTRPAVLGGDWELRFGPENRFRVFYRVDVPRREVQVLAIGVKKGSSLIIGGIEVKL